MSAGIAALAAGFAFTGDLAADVIGFLQHHGRHATAAHTPLVVAQGRQIAAAAGLDAARVEQACWLHDLGRAVNVSEAVPLCRSLGLEVLPEEEAHPSILHQKLSPVIAAELFGIGDVDVLAAVRCHTTLRAGATSLDKAVLLADKLAWDGADELPYRKELLAAIGRSLDEAVRLYLQKTWEARAQLRVIHPWLREACAELVGPDR